MVGKLLYGYCAVIAPTPPQGTEGPDQYHHRGYIECVEGEFRDISERLAGLR